MSAWHATPDEFHAHERAKEMRRLIAPWCKPSRFDSIPRKMREIMLTKIYGNRFKDSYERTDKGTTTK